MTNSSEPRFDLDGFLPYRLSVLASRVSAALAAAYGQSHAITTPEWRVLVHLSAHHKVSVREIHRRVDMDKSKVSRAAMRLEARGLIAKKVASQDRRLVELSLTRKGRALFDEIAPAALDVEHALLAALAPGERAAFRAAVDRLIAHLPKAESSVDEGR